MPASILQKAFVLLRCFGPDNRLMTLTELARAADLAKSTTHRLLVRLVDLDVIEQTDMGYRISLDFVSLGATTPAAGMRDLAMPYLAGLHRWSGMTVHFGSLRKFDVFYLEKLSAPGDTTAMTHVGARVPANCSAIGKSMLAWDDPELLAKRLPRPLPGLTRRSITDPQILINQLRRIKLDGLAREDGEAIDGMACIAAPVIADHHAIAAVSVMYPRTERPPDKLSGAVRDMAAHIARSVREAQVRSGQTWYPREL